MNHPQDETLAAFTDRMLDHRQFEAVREHLAECESCRRQVEMAARASQALAGLGETEVPLGVTAPVLAQAGVKPGERSKATAPSPRVPRAYRLMAAAAAVLLIVVGSWAAISSLTGSEDGMSTASGGAAAAAPEIPAADTQKLESLASEKALALDEGAPAVSGEWVEEQGNTEYSGDNAAVPSTTPGASREVAGAVSDALTPRVSRCLDMAGALDQGGTALEVVKDTYAGTDAYFVVLSEGPRPGALHDRVTVWVFARSGCRILALTTKYYPSMRPSPPTAFPSP